MTAARWRDDADDLVKRLRPRGGEQAVVAFQGERGAFGHMAIEQVWGARAWVLPCWSFTEVISAVKRGRAAYAVLPVHNEIIGAIAGVAEAIAESGLERIGDIRQPVRHALLGVPGSALGDVASVFSHPAALMQCRAFLARNPSLVPRESYDTAGAARDVAARGHLYEAAIASEACVDRYGLQLLARDIGDCDDNATVFAVVRGVR